jgi:hypothetical protein
MQEAKTKYHDTAAGVEAMLRANAQLDLSGAQYLPDGWVRGVWRFVLRDGRAGVAYLAGYEDPYGRVREWNDFEC